MARFLWQKENSEARGFPFPSEEIAPATASDEPELRVGVEFVGAFERLSRVFLCLWGTPPTRVAETELSRDHLADGCMGGARFGSAGVGA